MRKHTTIQNISYKKLLVCLCVIYFLGCKESFEPNLPSVPQGYLVVEGFINAQGPTQIKLSRSVPIDQKKTLKPELNAQVIIEGDNNSSYLLTASTGGFYSSASLNLNVSHNYRIRINTREGKQYLSEFVPVKLAPDIDSINWKQLDDGVEIYVNTHDPQNSTRYYRWDYQETWEIRSAYFAFYKLDRVEPITGKRIIREVNANDPNVFFCWKYDTLKNILLGSSAKLENDIVHQQPIMFISRMDERLGIRYSILVRQFALDKPGYEFFEQMKKNTELLGSIFDPQPSVLKGNIKCLSDPGELVVGYVNVTTVKEKRLFIADLELNGRGFNIYDQCDTVEISTDPNEIQRYIPPAWPYDAIFFQGVIIGYRVSTEKCVDCTSRGGKNVKPSYW